MTVDSDEDVEKLKAAGQVVANTLYHMAAHIEPGITTLELDNIGRAYLEQHGAKSAPEITYNYPGATCISVNECVAHGIPDGTAVEAGDMINIDVSAELNGFYGDTGASFLVPPSKPVQVKVCKATKKARDFAIETVRAGLPLNVIGRAVETVANKYKLSIVKNLTSHGIGRKLHEEPRSIPSYYDDEDTRVLQKGSVITIEPFLSTTTEWVSDGHDKWSLFGLPGSYTAQYEHTLIVTDGEPIITTIPTIN